jgi:DNA-binding MarR family transcriptional regulator
MSEPSPAESPAAMALHFTELTLQLAELLLHEMHRFAALHRMDIVHLRALLFLDRANRYSNTLAGLTDYLGLTKGTVSKSVALLEQAGHLRRTPDSQDRRVQHLSLTASGEDVVQRLLTHLRLGDIARCMGMPQAEQATQMLRHVLSTCQRLNQRRAFGICQGCRHHQRTPMGGFCGLTQQPLDDDQSQRLCREFASPWLEVLES